MVNQNSATKAAAFFDGDIAVHYDERNSQLSPIADNLHFLLRLVLNDLPETSRILCIGVGTGADILALATAFPNWQFVGVDPSADMLAMCRTKLEQKGLLERCELVHGDISTVQETEFDAAVSLLVAHFVSLPERPEFYASIKDRLRPGGVLASAEICFDLASEQFPAALENWKQVQTLMGATPESLQQLAQQLRDTLTVLSPAKTETLVNAAGFQHLVWFFQSFLIRGWYAKV